MGAGADAIVGAGVVADAVAGAGTGADADAGAGAGARVGSGAGSCRVLMMETSLNLEGTAGLVVWVLIISPTTAYIYIGEYKE